MAPCRRRNPSRVAWDGYKCRTRAHKVPCPLELPTSFAAASSAAGLPCYRPSLLLPASFVAASCVTAFSSTAAPFDCCLPRLLPPLLLPPLLLAEWLASRVVD